MANITSLSDDKWFLVQTNFDHFAGDCRIRCEAANANMGSVGRANMTMDNAYNEVLMQWPNLNLLSIHSTVMIPSTHYSKSVIVTSTNNTDPGDL